MLHDGGQRHRKRPRQLADRDRVMLAQPRQQGPAGRIGQRREGAIQRGCLILNHTVKYRDAGACCQVTPFRLALLSFRGAPQGANPESSNHRLRLLDSGLAARSQVYAGCVNLPAPAPRNDSVDWLGLMSFPAPRSANSFGFDLRNRRAIEAMPLKRGCFQPGYAKRPAGYERSVESDLISHAHSFPDAEIHSIHSKGASTCLLQKNRFISISQ